MKKLLKVLVIIVGILLLILLLTPLLFKKQIVSKIKAVANEQLNATLAFDNDISLGFFRHFPNASLGVDDLSVVGKGAFAGDTLAAADELQIVIDLRSLFGNGAYRIKNVLLDHPYIQLLVDSAGQANWDIMKTDSSADNEETTASSFQAALQQYAITDGRLVYADSTTGFVLKAVGLQHQGKGDFTQDVFDLSTHSEIEALTLAYGGISYLRQIHTDLDADLHIDLPRSKYSFNKSSLRLNGLDLGIDGYIALPDSNNMAMDLSFKAEEAAFKNFLSLIPAIYQKNFDDLEASGKLAFNGFVKGTYNDQQVPTFGLSLQVANGMFKYPSVPEPLSQVNLDLTVNNPDGQLDHTVIEVRQLHFLMGQNPFDAHLVVKNPQSDPYIDGAVKGKLNLAEVAKIYPLEKGTELAGQLDADVQAKGRMSAIEKQQYSAFDARGYAQATDLKYRSADLPLAVRVPTGKLTFSPQKVQVSDLAIKIGNSDIQAAGKVDNLFGYLFAKDKLKGNLDVRSQLLDLNAIMGADTAAMSTAETDTSSQIEAVIIPKNIAFELQTTIGHFIYDNYDLRDIKGKVNIDNGILTVEQIRTRMLDGDVLLSGTYNTQNPEIPKTDMRLKVEHMDIRQTFNTFNTVQALAPVAAFVQGNFSGDINLSSLLDQHLMPKLTSINSLGNLQIPNLNIKGFTPLMELASKLNIAQLKNLNLKSLLVHFNIDSGFLKVKPFHFAVDGIPLQVSGKNGLNKVIDYTIDVNLPRSKLGDADKALQNLTQQARQATGSDLELGDSVAVKVLLGGTLTQPKIRLDLSEEKEQLQQALKSEAKEQLKQQAGKLLDKVLPGDSSATDSAADKPAAKDKLKNAVEQGLKGLFNKKKKDTGS